MDPKEKIKNLKRHLELVENRTNGVIPDKHQSRKQEYQEWLALEIKRTKAKIELLILSLPVKR